MLPFRRDSESPSAPDEVRSFLFRGISTRSPDLHRPYALFFPFQKRSNGVRWAPTYAFLLEPIRSGLPESDGEEFSPFLFLRGIGNRRLFGGVFFFGSSPGRFLQSVGETFLSIPPFPSFFRSASRRRGPARLRCGRHRGSSSVARWLSFSSPRSA